MDFGRLHRGRLGIWKWVLVPPVVLLAMYYGTRHYALQTRATLERRAALTTVIPVAEAAVARAETALQPYRSGAQGVEDATAALSVRMNRTAEEYDFSIHELSIDPKKKEEGLLDIVRVRVAGKGEMHALTGFLYALAREEALLLPDDVEIRLETVRPRYRYAARFSFEYAVVRAEVWQED